MTRPHETVDFDELNKLADGHLPPNWTRAGDVQITCGVARHGTTWTVTVRARSERGSSRYLWFHGNAMVDAIDLAKSILRGPWRGFEIFR